jgi:hypothetical protein
MRLSLRFVFAFFLLVFGFAQASRSQTFTCSPPAANQIVCENSQPGTPESQWMIVGSGDPSIQGFATSISVNQGETVHFKIKTDARAYTLDIYRMGYYQGNGARYLTSILPSAQLPQTQPTCLTSSTTGLMDCGNWAESASWTAPANATSGLYFAELTRTDTGGGSQIFFVVRNDNSNSAILYQTSDTTAVAYNPYGGNNLYSANTSAGRAYKASYNRPFATQDYNSGQSWFLNSEYPLIRWLEANGYDVTYSTGIDTDRFGSHLLNHKLFISSGHDEYWSGNQRTNVEAARAAKVNLAFFSANEVFWKIRWENSTDASNTPYRTLVCYKETHANQVIDPADPPTWTGTWRDPRFSPPADGGRPENALTGTIFFVNGTREDAITVPAAFGKLRFWRNTNIAGLGAGQVATLPLGTLGFEWDQDVDNGFRPNGLINLSSTTLNVNGFYLVDYGNTFGPGTATHSLTLYRASSGALVFGAGTVQWAWGLDSDHTNGSAPAASTDMRQATVNLFADMGVQPGSLQSGLLPATPSTDTSPPSSVITSPMSGASFAAGSTVTIAGAANDAGGGVVAAVEVSVDGGTTWHRAATVNSWSSWTYSWVPAVTGSVTIKSRAIDDSLNIETPSAGVTVTITGQAPVISNVQTPLISSSGATITWNTDVPSSSQINYGTTTAYGSSTPLNSTQVTSHAVSLTGLTANTLYHFQVLSQGGNGALAISGDFNFTTAATGGGSGNVTLWSPSTVPAIASQSDSSSIELGVKFTSDITGYITGIRFYKGPTNAGTHVASLWSSGGTLLTSATFYSETASGWQQADFSAPVAISANTVYVASYHAPNGGYSLNSGYFASAGYDNAPLHALKDGASGGNGLFLYSSTSAFPTNSYVSSNYWVDVVFSQTGKINPPVISNVQAVQITPTTAKITWNTDKPSSTQVNYGTSIPYSSSTPLNSSLATNHSVNLSALTASTLYHFRVLSQDVAGNLTTSADSTFTTAPPRTTPPVITNVQATAITSSTATITWTTDELSGSQVNYGKTSAYGSSAPVDSTLVTTHSVNLSGLGGSTLYHFQVVSQDTSGNTGMSGDFTFTTSVPVPVSLWSPSTVPTVASQADTSAVELGAKFTSDVAGYVTSVRFYKGSSNTGTHVGTLWTSSGTLLATATFTNETATGWQQVTFSTPVLISANTVYVVSYRAPNGGYSVNRSYFAAAGFDNTPLHALKDGTNGGNGLFRYDATSAFPTNTYLSTNYWVDIVFNQIATSTPAVISNVQAVAITTSGATITWTTDKPATSAVNYGTTTAYGSSVSNSSLVTSHSVNLTGLIAGTVYHFQVQSTDVAGNLTTSSDFTFTTATPRTTPPVISNVQATAITSSGAMITWTTDEPASSQVNYGLSSTYGSSTPVDNTLVISHSVTLTSLSSNSIYHYQVLSRDASSNSGASTDFTFATSPIPPTTIWTASTTPAVASQNDPSSVELGVKFKSDSAGYITGIRFYKGPANTGSHVGSLWSSTGALLSSVTFAGESASGWQEADFSTPVQISTNTVYVASYHAPNGGYALNTNYFINTGYDNVPLHALKDGASGGNGVFAYGDTTVFPTNSSGSGNYWVDVVFSQAATSNPPVISSVQATQITTSTATITWTTDKPATSLVNYGTTTAYGSSTSLDTTRVTSHSASLAGLLANTLYHFQVQSTDVAGNLTSSADFTFTTPPVRTTPPVITNVLATAVTNSSATITWTTDEPANSQVKYGTSSAYGSSTPTDNTMVTSHSMNLTGLLANTSYHFQVLSVDATGNPASSNDFTFTTSASTPVSIWTPTSTPGILSQSDASSVELGAKFTSDVAGYITGIRFYKGTANTGTHIGSLWTSSGSLLASATFTNETATGWQQVTFGAPVAISANTVYVASYHAPNGGYSLNLSYFANTAYDNTPLHALRDGVNGGNGLYLYGSTTAFPTNTYSSSNYWVDVIFVSQ